MCSKKAKGYASNVSEQAGQVASRIGNSVEQTYESSRDYVTHRGLSGMGEDVTDLIRKNPLPAVFIGLGIGFLLALRGAPRGLNTCEGTTGLRPSSGAEAGLFRCCAEHDWLTGVKSPAYCAPFDCPPRFFLFSPNPHLF